MRLCRGGHHATRGGGGGSFFGPIKTTCRKRRAKYLQPECLYRGDVPHAAAVVRSNIATNRDVTDRSSPLGQRLVCDRSASRVGVSL